MGSSSTRASEVAALLRETRWNNSGGEAGSYLTDIVKSGQILPLVAKVSQGSYSGLTAGCHVLLISCGHTHSLVGQCVKFKKKTGVSTTTRVSPFGPTLLIPSTFQGHFEILNEEGRSVPSFLSVEAMSRSGTKSCLVRDPFKAWLAEGDEKTYRIGSKSRTLLPGEVITLVGVVSVPSKSNKVVGKYVRCLDQDKLTVFLPCGAKGKFSPVAGGCGDQTGDGIGGVHTTRGILSKRLPLMVRLVEGRPPSNGRNFKFFPELRLYSTLKEQLLFALPLSPSWKESLVPLPTSAPLKFQVAKNMDELEGVAQFSSVAHKAGCLLHQVKDRIQIYDISLQKELPRFDGRQWKAYAPPIFLTPKKDGTTLIVRSESHNNPISGGQGPDEEEEEEEYQDIDELYDYVRGLKPSPPNTGLTSTTSTNSPHNNKPSTPQTTLVTITSSGPDVIAHVTSNNNHDRVNHHPPHTPDVSMLKFNKNDEGFSELPPQPPPIETIPSRLNKTFAAHPQDLLPISLLNSKNSDRETHHHHHIHHHYGTQIQIQIRADNEDNNNDIIKYHHQLTKGVLITTTTTSTTGGSSSNNNNKKPLQLDSAGGSVSTTPTNTSGSAQSSSSSNSNSKQLRTGGGLYIKHGNGGNNNKHGGLGMDHQQGHHYHHHHHHPADANHKSSQPAHIFRRCPMFDTRYKSLTDLSNPLANGGGGGLYFGGRGSLTNLTSNQISMDPVVRVGNPRPKSLSNMFALDDMVQNHHRHPHGSGGGSSGNVSRTVGMGVRKRITELVLGGDSKGKSSSQRSARHFRKASLQHSSLFL
ncbi:uncharacterized protein LOC110842043 [Folsomia candida]|nr:uncharacterized protein LOC110842043 [Folsomia candida]